MMLLAATLQYAKALVIQNSSRRACYSSSTTTRLYANSNINSENNDVHGKHYNIKGNGQQSIVKMQTNTGHTIQTDIPHKMGGKDTAPQPVEHLLAAH